MIKSPDCVLLHKMNLLIKQIQKNVPSKKGPLLLNSRQKRLKSVLLLGRKCLKEQNSSSRLGLSFLIKTSLLVLVLVWFG